jgi:hypothetical protein
MATNTDRKKKASNPNGDYRGRRNIFGQVKDKQTNITTERNDKRGTTTTRKEVVKTRSISPKRTVVVKSGSTTEAPLGYKGIFKSKGDVKAVKTKNLDNFIKRKGGKYTPSSNPNQRVLVTKKDIEVKKTTDAFRTKKKELEKAAKNNSTVMDLERTNTMKGTKIERNPLNKTRIYKAKQLPKRVAVAAQNGLMALGIGNEYRKAAKK